MEVDVLNPCPTCGRRFDFWMTGCMTFVAEGLQASTGGNCPACGTQVVVEKEPSRWRSRLYAFEEACGFDLSELEFSVRCRLVFDRRGITKVNQLIGLSMPDLLEVFNGSEARAAEVVEQLALQGLTLAAATTPSRQHLELRSELSKEAAAIPVVDMDLSVRVRNVLHKNGIANVGDLARWTRRRLLQLFNDEQPVQAIESFLADCGLELANDGDE